MREMNLNGTPEGKHLLGDLHVDGRMILNVS
jgi:hypothetical protein